MQKEILDACCGGRMFHFDKQRPDVLFMDCRTHSETLDSGHIINVDPDIIGDFRDMPFGDDSFHLVIFDPPHLLRAGDNSWMKKKYGVLQKDTWKQDLTQGFNECMRVLKPGGTLIFKWNDTQIALPELLPLFDATPIIGQKRQKTHWLVFYKSFAVNNPKTKEEVAHGDIR